MGVAQALQHRLVRRVQVGDDGRLSGTSSAWRDQEGYLDPTSSQPTVGRAGLDCPGGHGLERFEARRRYGCDICGAKVAKGSTLFGCRDCDHDVCQGCFEASGTPSRASRVRWSDQAPELGSTVLQQTLNMSGTSFFSEAARGAEGSSSEEEEEEEEEARWEVVMRWDRKKQAYRKVRVPAP